MKTAKHFIPLTDTPDPEKARLSSTVAEQTAAFLASGGVIQQAGNTQVKDLQPVQDGRKQITLMSKAQRREILSA